MKEEMTDYLFHKKGPLSNFWTIIVLVGAVLLTFLITQSEYENKLDAQASASLKSTSLMNSDFTEMLNQTTGQMDCSKLIMAANVSFCESVNETRGKNG